MLKRNTMDLEKLARDIKELLKVGELNYEGPCSGVVQEQANKAAKDAEKAVSVVPAVQSLDILEKVVVIAVTNESDVELEILKQFTKVPASRGGSLCQSSLRVNLAGLSAENHPRQSQRNLWVRHTTWKVVQGQIISKVKKGKVVDLVAGIREAVGMMFYKLSLYRKSRQVQKVDMVKVEVMAIPGVSSVNKQEFKKFEGFLSLFCSKASQEETRGCTTQFLLLVSGTYEEPCNG